MEIFFDADKIIRDLSASTDPISVFKSWMKEAESAESADANAMSLATVDENNCPNVRVVLVKDIDTRGLTFFSNFFSVKAKELELNPKCSGLVHWKTLARQVRFRGFVRKLPDEESDDYFHSRPRLSKIGAWASKQSEILENRDNFIKRIKYFENKYPNDIPRPDYWGGFVIEPKEMELWIQQDSRLHYRKFFYKNPSSNKDCWESYLLYP